MYHCLTLLAHALFVLGAFAGDDLWRISDDLENYTDSSLCSIDFFDNFYLLDLTWVIDNVTENECILLCEKLIPCRSGNYIGLNYRCYLSTSNGLQPPNDLHYYSAIKSRYFWLKCPQKPLRLSSNPDSGLHAGMCGIPAFPNDEYIHMSKRIVGGEVVTPYAYPWLGMVMTYVDGRFFGTCGVVLITANPKDMSTRWALTAAHCISFNITTINQSARSFRFVFGVYDRRFPSPHQIIRESCAVYPYSTTITRSTDVVLVEFEQEIYFNRYVRPICLPLFDEVPKKDCWISGWGRVGHDNNAEIADQLQHALANLLIGGRFQLVPKNRKNIVALRWLGNYKGPGLGDSGGPLMCKVNDRYFLYGLIRSGRNPKVGYDGIFYNVKVSKLIPWIEQIIGSR